MSFFFVFVFSFPHLTLYASLFSSSLKYACVWLHFPQSNDFAWDQHLLLLIKFILFLLSLQKLKIPTQKLFMLFGQMSGKLFFFSKQDPTSSAFYFAVLVPIRHVIVLILLWTCRFLLKSTQLTDEEPVKLNFVFGL